MAKSRYNKRGFSMIEVIVSVALATVIVLAMTELNTKTLKFNQANREELVAILYASEMIEVAHDLEISNWNALKNTSCTLGAPCHVVLSSGFWSIIGGQESAGVYKRSLVIDPIRRSSCSFPNTIVDTGGSVCPSSVNPDTLRVASTVTWTDALGSHTLTLETYVYDIM